MLKRIARGEQTVLVAHKTGYANDRNSYRPHQSLVIVCCILYTRVRVILKESQGSTTSFQTPSYGWTKILVARMFNRILNFDRSPEAKISEGHVPSAYSSGNEVLLVVVSLDAWVLKCPRP